MSFSAYNFRAHFVNDVLGLAPVKVLSDLLRQDLPMGGLVPSQGDLCSPGTGKVERSHLYHFISRIY